MFWYIFGAVFPLFFMLSSELCSCSTRNLKRSYGSAFSLREVPFWLNIQSSQLLWVKPGVPWILYSRRLEFPSWSYLLLTALLLIEPVSVSVIVQHITTRPNMLIFMMIIFDYFSIWRSQISRTLLWGNDLFRIIILWFFDADIVKLDNEQLVIAHHEAAQNNFASYFD